jgi:hypothetical protein
MVLAEPVVIGYNVPFTVIFTYVDLYIYITALNAMFILFIYLIYNMFGPPSGVC